MMKLMKAVAMILVLVMAWSSVSAVLAEENAEQAAQTEAPEVHEPAPEPEPIVVEAPKPEPPAPAPEAPKDNAVSAQNEAPAETAAPDASGAPQETAAPDNSQVPETTTTPVDAQPTATPEATDTEIIAQALPTEESALDLSNVSITIHCLNGTEAKLGDDVTLSAKITGLDGVEYSVTWQYQSGGQWHNASGSHGNTYRYTLSEKNANYNWRLALSIG